MCHISILQAADGVISVQFWKDGGGLTEDLTEDWVLGASSLDCQIGKWSAAYRS